MIVHCFCTQPPRLLLHGMAVCRCPHIVYRQTFAFAPPSFAPSTIGNSAGAWQAVPDGNLRRKLVREAKQLIGIDTPVISYENVQAATEAARMAGAEPFAANLEYEQWVAALEE